MSYEKLNILYLKNIFFTIITIVFLLCVEGDNMPGWDGGRDFVDGRTPFVQLVGWQWCSFYG